MKGWCCQQVASMEVGGWTVDLLSSFRILRWHQQEVHHQVGHQQAGISMNTLLDAANSRTSLTGMPIFVTALQSQQVEESPQPWSLNEQHKLLPWKVDNCLDSFGECILLVFMEFTGSWVPQPPNCPSSPLPVLATVHPLLSDSPPPLSPCTCFLGTK